MVKARNFFFVPFFGAFHAFVVTQSKYIIDAHIVVKTLIVVTFLLGVVYAWTVSNYLWTLERLRFMYSYYGSR